MRASASRPRVAGLTLALAAACLTAAVVARQTPPAQTAPAAAFTLDQFETRIRPLLAANCYACHADAATRAKPS
jgi:hypothetical protein